MSEQILIDHCSPTLAGLKTANMFQADVEESKDIRLDLQNLNRLLGPKSLRIVLMRQTAKKALIYVYRPDCLDRDLRDPEARRILEEKGYQGSTARCIVQLIHHMMNDVEFPHEVGLFLGYPPEDVRCFMRDARNGVKCSGCWKAYGNEEEAQKTFLRYKKCTQVYQRELAKGRSLFQLTVRKHLKNAG